MKNTMIICLKKGFGADKPDLFYKPANKFQNSLPNVTYGNKSQKSALGRGFFVSLIMFDALRYFFNETASSTHTVSSPNGLRFPCGACASAGTPK